MRWARDLLTSTYIWTLFATIEFVCGSLTTTNNRLSGWPLLYSNERKMKLLSASIAHTHTLTQWSIIGGTVKHESKLNQVNYCFTDIRDDRIIICCFFPNNSVEKKTDVGNLRSHRAEQTIQIHMLACTACDKKNKCVRLHKKRNDLKFNCFCFSRTFDLFCFFRFSSFLWSAF